ncbi:hypothetical protein BH11PSE9_BH11PSE9_15050 [soil metagenome]
MASFEVPQRAMLTLPGFGQIELLDEDALTRVYRAIDLREGAAVILKTPHDEPPAPESLERLRLEHAMLAELGGAGSPRPRALLQHGASLVLVLDDIQGERLTTLIEAGPMQIDRFFEIALPLTEALAAIHARGIIHHDLRPHNVVVAAATGRLEIVGLGEALHAPRARHRSAPSEAQEASLAYLSPEQTGRMNRGVDERTDFYSLGATFYEMLTGRPPFVTRDALELVHSHLARTPEPPGDIRREIPPALSAVVMKLLAKLAEERYQSAAGLRADLLRCQREPDAEPFELGSADVSDRFQLSQLLHEREAQTAALLDAFDRVAAEGGPEAVYVSGVAGIGKSMLVAELHKPLLARRAFFIESRAEQGHHGVPGAVITEALRGLTQQLLAIAGPRLDEWRERICAALGSHLPVLAAWVPQVQAIVGPQPPPAEGKPEESQRLVQRSVREFVSVCARPEHPLVLFFDNLQWADASSLEAIAQLLADPPVRYLSVIGAFGPHDTSEATGDVQPGAASTAPGPLEKLQADIAAQGIRQSTIALAPLSRPAVAQLLSDTLRCGTDQVAALAATVYAKTRGNPFFTHQFIEWLHRDGLITFDPAQRRWVWDEAAAASRDFADNVVELMLAELMQLPEATRQVLALAGFLGNPFGRSTLAIVAGPNAEAAEEALRPAITIGLLTRDGDHYRFLHHRAQEAARALTPPQASAHLHWQIGCRLLAHLSAEQREARCFEIADHLNRGAADTGTPVPSAECRHEAARVNLQAGRKALAASGHVPAARHFAAGVALLGDDGWADDYPLAFALHLGQARCVWLAGDFPEATRHVEILQAHARSEIDWAQAADVGIAAHLSQHDGASATALVLDSLRRLGLELPAHPSRQDVERVYEGHLALLDGRPIESMADLPPMTDARSIAAMQLLASTHGVTFYANRDLWALMVCLMVTTTQRHGLADTSTAGFARFGYMLAIYLYRHHDANLFSDLALRLWQRRKTPHDRAQVLFLRAHVRSWLHPIEEAIELEEQALQAFVEIGDRIGAGICAERILTDRFMRGEPLPELAAVADQYLQTSRQANIVRSIQSITIRRQQIRSLRGLTRSFGSLDDVGTEAEAAPNTLEEGRFTEAAFLEPAALPRTPITICWFEIARLITRCIAGEYQAGFDAARAIEPRMALFEGLAAARDYHCFDALCITALIGDAPASERPGLRERLRRHEERLGQWARLNPAGFGSTHLLVMAEIARTDALPLQAMPLYEQALMSARAQGHLQFEALANERAAWFYRDAGVASVADSYQQAARAAYARWGADAKVRQIDAFHPHLARASAAASAPDDDGRGAARFDALAVVKATQAISGPMLPEQLLRELLTIVLQQAGAQFGALLLVQHGTLALAATALVGKSGVEVALLGDSAGGSAGDSAGGSSGDSAHRGALQAAALQVPESIAAYVWRSGERVLLEDARAPNPFTADPALATGRARSVLALPIVRQAGVKGVLYLEHRDAPRVFTLASVAVVEQLAAQAAISLEGSRLYAELAEQQRTLEAKVEARTAELERSRNILHTMLDGMPAMISMKGLDGRYLLHNRHFAEQVGRPGESLIGFRADELFEPDQAARLTQRDDDVLRTGRIVRSEEDMVTRSASTLVQIVKFPMLDSNGAIDGVGTISIDVTELSKARIAAEAAAEAKSQFLANMSHEIRTPMNAILGMAHLALRSGLNAQQQNYVQKVEHSARSLLGLINAILDFSKIEAGKLELESRMFDLRELLDKLDGVIGLQAEEKKLELLFDIAPDVPTALIGDPMRLGQVLTNLCNNAIKFTERGEVVLRIESAGLEGGNDRGHATLRFSLRDTGVGMSAAERERLFKPFTQADPSTSRRYGGTGLGLAISSQIVRLMGGHIEVESVPGKGSIFTFDARLALQPPGDSAAAWNDAALSALRLRGKRLLLVDDNTTARGILMALCDSAGCTAESARDAWDAMRAVTLAKEARQPFDLVVIDGYMPGMDGAECAHKLARGAHGERPVVLMCSPFSRDGLMKRLAALQLVPADVIAKPVMATQFFDACASALGAPPREGARRETLPPAETRHHASLKGAHVLLVEDNPINQELALELLREAGMVVAVAENGRDAITLLERESFDLVLMDCQMPVLDGYEATREIRRRPQWAELPIIAMTANAMSGDQRKAQEAGMNDHIAKPIDVDAMFEVIARWLDTRRAANLAAAAAIEAAQTSATHASSHTANGATTHGPGHVPAHAPFDAATTTARSHSMPTPTSAAPPSPTPSATPALPADLPGIDTRIGLASTIGNVKLYRRLLVKFRDGQSGFIGAFRNAQANGDATTATRLAHDLRAVSGTLGAHQVELHARALETACREGESADQLDALATRVAEALGPVVAGLAVLGN